MLEKTKALFALISVALCTVSCTQAEPVQSNAEPPQTSIPSSDAATSSNAETSGLMLNAGDLKNVDKLLLQVNRANQADKDFATASLEAGKMEMKKERQEGLHGGRSGLSKITCVSPMHYPTVDGLTDCAEAISLEQSNFEGKLKNFQSSAELYRTALLFSERTNASLPDTERSKIEENIACLDAFIKAPDPETPGCELVRVALLDPQLPGGKILPPSTGEQ
jgi:hypothetical protein